MRTLASVALIFFAAGCSILPFRDEEEAAALAQLEGAAYVAGATPEDTLRVVLLDVSRADAAATTISEAVLHPVPAREAAFSLSYDPNRIDPRHRYLVRGELRSADGVLRATTTRAYPVLTGGAPARADIVLEQIAAPAAADPWTEAGVRGVSFRGIGQEPGWTMEIVENRTIVLVLDYGAETISGPAPPAEPIFNGRRYTLDAAANTITIEIKNMPCADAMSGAPFPAVVTVMFSGRTLHGCGRAL